MNLCFLANWLCDFGLVSYPVLASSAVRKYDSVRSSLRALPGLYPVILFLGSNVENAVNFLCVGFEYS